VLLVSELLGEAVTEPVEDTVLLAVTVTLEVCMWRQTDDRAGECNIEARRLVRQLKLGDRVSSPGRRHAVKLG